LLQKLRAIGVSAIPWFESYLSNREQCVEVNGSKSDFMKVGCGVPQGSILGPQLFLIYINDMQMSIRCKLALYADDSALIFSHRDSNTIATRLSNELSDCKRWLTDNKLSLHVGKTECLLFGTRRRLGKVRDFQVSCDGVPVKRVDSVKYLGVYLDANLCGVVHATTVIKSCIGRLSFLYRNGNLLDFNCRKMLCSALIQPYIDYCCTSWYSTLTKQLRSKLDVLQRRMIRFMYSKDSRDHIDNQHLKTLSWLSIPDRVAFFKLLHIFRIRNNTAPVYLRTNFEQLRISHSHKTRSSIFDFSITKEVSMAPKSFTYTGIRLWNDLPNSLKEIQSESIFRSRLKQYFLARY